MKNLRYKLLALSSNTFAGVDRYATLMNVQTWEHEVMIQGRVFVVKANIKLKYKSVYCSTSWAACASWPPTCIMSHTLLLQLEPTLNTC